MIKTMCVFGTRPEAIKMCPLVYELNRRENIHSLVCITGQHKEMLMQVLECFGVVPDYNLHIMKQGQNLFDITINILSSIKEILEKERPDIVYVHGDTTTAFAASLACFYLGIPVGHVEAGLRTYDLNAPFPEEYNRQAIGIVANLHFAPTAAARDNLIAEQKPAERIFVTGNTAIDALMITAKENYTHPILDWAKGSRLIVLTAHRRENLGEPMKRMFRQILKITQQYPDVKVVYPVHLNPKVRDAAYEIFGDSDKIKLCEPLDVIDFHNIMAKSYFILTDSGGIQEEAPSLGKPVLVLRDKTERPEELECGGSVLIGTNGEKIFEVCGKLLDDEEEYKRMANCKNPFGDGTASKQIVDITEKYFGGLYGNA